MEARGPTLLSKQLQGRQALDGQTWPPPPVPAGPGSSGVLARLTRGPARDPSNRDGLRKSEGLSLGKWQQKSTEGMKD